MAVLKERGLSAGSYGQALLAAVSAGSVTILLVSVYVVVRTEGLSPQIMPVLLFGASAAAYRLVRLGGVYLVNRR